MNEEKKKIKEEESKGHEYVDDVSVTAKAATVEAFEMKLVNHLIVVNSDKTQVMVINPGKVNPQYQ